MFPSPFDLQKAFVPWLAFILWDALYMFGICWHSEQSIQQWLLLSTYLKTISMYFNLSYKVLAYFNRKNLGNFLGNGAKKIR